MSEPTSALSFRDLVTKVAEFAGLASYGSTGTGKATVPIDLHDLDVCKRIVNNAIRMFISDAPPNGWRWQRRMMQVNLVVSSSGTATAGAATTLTDSTLAPTLTADGNYSATTMSVSSIAGTYADDYFNGRTILVTGGTGDTETATVTDYTGSTGLFTFAGGLSGASTPDATTEFSVGLYSDDYYNDCILEITGGTGLGETALITDYTGNTGTFTFSALSGASTPSTTSTYEIGSRYKLADDFGGSPEGIIAYSRESNRGTPIDWTNEGTIRRLRENSNNNGYPQLAAIRPYGVRQFELVVYPDPTAVDVIEFPYTLFYDDLRLETGVATGGTATTLIDTANRLEVDDAFKTWILTITSGTALDETATITSSTVADNTLTFTGKLSGETTPDTTSIYMLEPPGNNLHPAGYRFDDIILTACLARAEMEIEDLSAGWKNMYTSEKLTGAVLIDNRSAPRKLGRLSNGLPQVRERTWSEVTY